MFAIQTLLHWPDTQCGLQVDSNWSHFLSGGWRGRGTIAVYGLSIFVTSHASLTQQDCGDFDQDKVLMSLMQIPSAACKALTDNYKWLVSSAV